MREQFLKSIEGGRPFIPKDVESKGGGSIQASEYLDQRLFQREQAIFRTAAAPVALETELDGDRSVLSFEYGGSPYIITKDRDGKIRGFINSCVHRGTKLLEKGFHSCKKAMTCPYHNWTYRLDGEIHKIPHSYGFPENLSGLAPIDVTVRNGIVWASPQKGTGSSQHALKFAQPPGVNLFPNSQNHEWTVHKRTQLNIAANWKLIVESALEFYHFKATHKATIYPAFYDNIGLVEQLPAEYGVGLKVTLPSKRIEAFEENNSAAGNGGKTDGHAAEHYSHILYYLFPGTFVLVEDSLVNVMRMDVVGIDETHIEMLHVVPKAKSHLRRVWDKRVEFTLRTLDEDYQRTRRIQETLEADPEHWFVHGSYEYGLGMFHDILKKAVLQ